MSKNNFLVGAFSFLLMLISGVTTAANVSSPAAAQDPSVEAAVEGTSKKIGINEATRTKAKTAEGTDSVDCFYEANKYHADCRNTRAGTR